MKYLNSLPFKGSFAAFWELGNVGCSGWVAVCWEYVYTNGSVLMAALRSCLESSVVLCWVQYTAENACPEKLMIKV